MSIALTQEEADLVRKRDRISAIKFVRARVGCALIMAKEIVDAWDGKTITKEGNLGKACTRCGGTGQEPIV